VTKYVNRRPTEFAVWNAVVSDGRSLSVEIFLKVPVAEEEEYYRERGISVRSDSLIEDCDLHGSIKMPI